MNSKMNHRQAVGQALLAVRGGAEGSVPQMLYRLFSHSQEWLCYMALVAAVLLGVGTALAQSSPAAALDSKPAPATLAAGLSRQSGPAAPTPVVAQAQATAAETPAAKPPAKGDREGIKVHGHWTIEVRNPDGSLDKHIEFENALVTSNFSDMPGGPALLFALLSGTYNFPAPPGSAATQAGGWAINLQPPSGSTSPCQFTGPGAGDSSGIDSSLTPSCFVTSVPTFCGTATDCNQGLQVTMNTAGTTSLVIPIEGSASTFSYPTPSGFTLSGSVVASQVGGSIGTVETITFLNVPLTRCLVGGGCGLTGSAISPVAFLFTSHPISPAVTVIQNQTVMVTVSFTFN